MAIAISELMIEGKEWTPLNIASKFVEVFHRERREGYAGRFYSFLVQTKTGQSFLDNIRPDSNKSGGAMRAPPLGLIKDKAEVIEKATIQCKLTHDTPGGIQAAVAAALMVWYLKTNVGPKAKLREFLTTELGAFWIRPHIGEVGSRGLDSVNAALTALEMSDSMAKILVQCVEWEGDVDTVAAVAMGAASVSVEIKSDLPPNLYENLERTRYGFEFLKELNSKLPQ